MNGWIKKRDVLKDKYRSEEALNKARKLLQADDQTEEQFLGAQGVLLLNGLL